jgi:hypothetical protein
MRGKNVNIENYIESQYRELQPNINIEYEDLYKEIEQHQAKRNTCNIALYISHNL